MIFHRDVCGILCALLTYVAMAYADYVVIFWLIRPTFTQRFLLFCTLKNLLRPTFMQKSIFGFSWKSLFELTFMRMFIFPSSWEVCLFIFCISYKGPGVECYDGKNSWKPISSVACKNSWFIASCISYLIFFLRYLVGTVPIFISVYSLPIYFSTEFLHITHLIGPNSSSSRNLPKKSHG